MSFRPTTKYLPCGCCVLPFRPPSEPSPSSSSYFSCFFLPSLSFVSCSSGALCPGRNRTYRFSLFSLRCSFPPRRRRTNVLEDEGASGGLSIYLFHCTVCISHLSSHNLHNELFQVKSVTKLSLVLICVLSVSLAVMQQSAAEKERGRSGQFGKRKTTIYLYFPPFSRTRGVLVNLLYLSMSF